MNKNMQKHNFGAGPCILPQEVFQEAAEAVKNWNGLSILEVSHRSKDFEKVMDDARLLVKQALNISDDYEVLFLQGGATLGFTIAALNFYGETGKAAYLNTGTWASGAIKEANKIGLNVEVVASSEDKNFSYIPKDYVIPSEADFLHFTSNNTIYGTQFTQIPKTKLPLICDMSSDIFSKEINVSDYDLIYAGAQKNLGPAGATLYIIKKSVLGKSKAPFLPSYLDLKLQAEKDSMFNTPPVFSVFVSMLNLKHLLATGGVKAAEERNNLKAETLYAEIDRNTLFEGTVAVEDRSKMNINFLLKNEEHQSMFDALWKEAGIIGLNGHRSVGGYRASMYNALPLESVHVLVNVMKELENKVR